MRTRSASEPAAHFAHYPLAMRLDCPLSCSQFGPRLLVQETGSNQTEDFAFTGREAAVALFEHAALDMLSTPFARQFGAVCYRTQ